MFDKNKIQDSSLSLSSFMRRSIELQDRSVNFRLDLENDSLIKFSIEIEDHFGCLIDSIHNPFKIDAIQNTIKKFLPNYQDGCSIFERDTTIANLIFQELQEELQYDDFICEVLNEIEDRL